ncbi:DUF1659 domain-containing protein [Tissierella creatinini]|nr:DUF1659 domain-containing protein [Tissierella creatinini]TJX59225.1 DUF1659 domain-containing protein [Soehngenia saccharolytica]
MAVIGIKERLSLKLELDDGLVDGKQKVKSKTLNNVKVNALDDNLHGTALALAGLQSKSLLKVKRVEETALTAE